MVVRLLVLGTLYAGTASVTWAVAGHWPGLDGHHLAELLAGITVLLAYGPTARGWQVLRQRWLESPRTPAAQLLAGPFQDLAADPASLAQQLLSRVRQGVDPDWCLLTLHDEVVIAWQVPPEVLDAGGDRGARAWTLPLEGASGPLGVLQLGARAGDFAGPERDFLRILADQYVVALDNRRLIAEQLQLQVAAQLAGAMAEERSALVRQLVHDLRTDLCNIVFGSHLVLARPGDERPLASIDLSLARIRDFLAEKVREAEGAMRPATTDLTPVLAELRELARDLLEAKQQHLELELPERDVAIPMSRVALDQVLVNLLTNAMRCSPPGSTIRLEVGLDGPEVALRLRDRGPGVPPVPLEEYLRALPPSRHGFGFGLKNAWALVTRAQGQLAWRRLEQGSEVEVRLPMRPRLRADADGARAS